jgi:hypothetical protein
MAAEVYCVTADRNGTTTQSVRELFVPFEDLLLAIGALTKAVEVAKKGRNAQDARLFGSCLLGMQNSVRDNAKQPESGPRFQFCLRSPLALVVARAMGWDPKGPMFQQVAGLELMTVGLGESEYQDHCLAVAPGELPDVFWQYENKMLGFDPGALKPAEAA